MVASVSTEIERPELREQMKAFYTAKRITELYLEPVDPSARFSGNEAWPLPVAIGKVATGSSGGALVTK